MPSTPSRASSNTQPALRIPTFDSMKRFSTTTDTSSDMPKFSFTERNGDHPLVLPAYLLNEIDTGRQAAASTPSIDHGGGIPSEGLKIDFRTTRTRDRSNDIAEINIKPGANPPAGLEPIPIPARTSSRVPFNPCRPISQITTNEGITALPTLASRGLHFNDHDKIASSTPNLLISRKRKSSFTLSGPIKRLRNLSFDSITNKLHKRRGSSLSCIEDPASNVSDEKRASRAPTKQFNTSLTSPSASPSTPATCVAPMTPTPYDTSTIATTVLPNYPLTSPVQSPQLPSPAQLLLPASNDLTCLTALQDLISNLHAENEILKQQVKVLRADWYATHDELLLERYQAWERECQLWQLRNSDESARAQDDRSRSRSGKSGSRNHDCGTDHHDSVVVNRDRDGAQMWSKDAMLGFGEVEAMVGVAR